MPYIPRSTYSVRLAEAGTNRRFSISGTGGTPADAKAEADAKLALTVGTAVAANRSESVDPATVAATNAGPLYSDAVLVVTKDDFSPDRQIRLENISTAYRLAGSQGKIDLSNAAIAAFVAAYKDADGVGGYVAVDGYYVD